MSWLYRYEAKGIQNYVLGTQRLVEIAGGSALVDQLPERLSAVLPAGPCIIQKAAGSATISFPDRESLKQFASTWPAHVATYAPGLHVVQAWTEDRDGALERLVTKALPAARQALYPTLPEAGPWVARAARTGAPAVASLPTHGRGLVDRATEARFDASDKDRLPDELGVGSDRVVQEHDEEFGQGDGTTLAVIHIDGNDVGRRVIERVSPAGRAAYESFSSNLAQATRAAATAALQGIEKVRPVVLGGDDFTYIVPAADGLCSVRRYLAAFEAETRARADSLHGQMTATAGLAFVKLKSPFHAAYHLAEELCSWAKTSLRQPDGTPSSLAFHRVTGSALESWDQVLHGGLAAAGLGRRLTGGPYRLSQFDALEALREHVEDSPRGALREWARLAKVDDATAAIKWRRLVEIERRRLSDSGGGRVEAGLPDVLAPLGCTNGPWTSDGRTPIYDALGLVALEVKPW